MAHSKGAVFIVLWMLLSLLNVLLHMRYNSNFHAPTAPNGCLMKRACVHKYEADGAQTTLFAISVNRILSSVLRMPERSSMYWILRGCGRMWANVDGCGWMWGFLVVGRLSHTPNHSRVEILRVRAQWRRYVRTRWVGHSGHSKHTIHPNAPRTETD